MIEVCICFYYRHIKTHTSVAMLAQARHEGEVVGGLVVGLPLGFSGVVCLVWSCPPPGGSCLSESLALASRLCGVSGGRACGGRGLLEGIATAAGGLASFLDAAGPAGADCDADAVASENSQLVWPSRLRLKNSRSPSSVTVPMRTS